MSTEKILEKSLINENSIVAQEAIKGTTFKYLGTINIDLYIFTNQSFIEKILLKNLFLIKKMIKEIDNKSVKDVYINNVLIKINLNELATKNNIDTIDITSIIEESTEEVSGENNIIGDVFKYESFLDKKMITISLYNKQLNKENNYKIETKILKSFSKFKKNKLILDLTSLLSLGFKPNNNDTKEVIKFLGIK